MPERLNQRSEFRRKKRNVGSDTNYKSMDCFKKVLTFLQLILLAGCFKLKRMILEKGKNIICNPE